MKSAIMVKAEFAARGETFRAWAHLHGYEYNTVLSVVHGRLKGSRGISHEIAVKLGMKHGAIRGTDYAGLSSLAGNPRRRARAKLAILAAWREFHRTSGMSVSAALPKFVARYNAWASSLGGHQRAIRPRISERSVRLWNNQVARFGPGRLAGHYGVGRRKSLIETDPLLKAAAIALLRRNPRARAPEIVAVFATLAPARIPSLRAVQRWVKYRRQTP